MHAARDVPVGSFVVFQFIGNCKLTEIITFIYFTLPALNYVI